MYDLTVVIATYNRPHFLMESIRSVLNQEYKKFYFIVSDNSDSDQTLQMLRENDLLDKLHYIKRTPMSALDHFNNVLNEIKTKYFILFHDDDIMLPGMIDRLYEAISDDETIVAVGCNGHILVNNQETKKRVLRSHKDILLLNQSDLVMRYCDGIVPFPSHIYNATLIKKEGIHFTNKAGKYSDAVWLLEIMRLGKILWLSEPLMLYRSHQGQDSSLFSYNNQQKLTNYFMKIVDNGKECKMLRDYRIMNLYKAMRRRQKTNRKISLYMIRQMVLLFRYSFFNYFIKYCIHTYVSLVIICCRKK